MLKVSANPFRESYLKNIHYFSGLSALRLTYGYKYIEKFLLPAILFKKSAIFVPLLAKHCLIIKIF